MNSQSFTKTFAVPASAIDERNHVNNLSYLQWCLDSAQEHWNDKASPSLKQQYVWYVLHHSIEYKAEAFAGEKLQLVTWVSSADGVRSERHYKIIRLADSKTIVEAKTLWCLLDASTSRPTPITEEIRNLFQ
ncbi:MAG TPA: thioesterase family protein [Flavobacteriaceae bacterium]|nr:acyl-CoA thioesterase [Flavobacteriaceae bacterium]MCB9212166.1 acyl-CoA thioesterase [Alteromonas sp.]HPF10456.1 thioesterase family protein [Flavobacteriaceae bacterium]HQU21765.1 thioesterase family protein [Flavobacteriaceae bacterium]HQU64667.1 thioesterase family protein [Flavobacteriaceae bacterium]